MWTRLLEMALTLATPIVMGLSDPRLSSTPVEVLPELVWHPDYGTALQASARSQRPVLLFQLLGNLDEALC